MTAAVLIAVAIAAFIAWAAYELGERVGERRGILKGQRAERSRRGFLQWTHEHRVNP